MIKRMGKSIVGMGLAALLTLLPAASPAASPAEEDGTGGIAEKSKSRERPGHQEYVGAGADTAGVKRLLIGVGDSLTQGTRDATNNRVHARNAFLHMVYEALKAEGRNPKFAQPWLSVKGRRTNPRAIPTNLGVDGEDIFSVEGIEYGRRVGTPGSNLLTNELMCDPVQAALLQDMHDRVLYPINLQAGKAVSQLDALIWHLNNRAGPADVVFWVGNNDAGLASLGLGGANPEFLPIPFEQVKDKLRWDVVYLLEYGRDSGALSFAPFTGTNIRRNLTVQKDFRKQVKAVWNRVLGEADRSDARFYVLTYPWYCDVGYMFDQADLEFYLGSLGRSVGGRVSLLTFICMYALRKSGDLAPRLNAVLDKGLIMNAAEQRLVRRRINSFNNILRARFKKEAGVTIVDVGEELNGLIGEGLEIEGEGLRLTRSWGYGHSFSLDGVHVSHTVHALIANRVLAAMGVGGDPDYHYDLGEVAAGDPYVDRDGDGWVRGPTTAASGNTAILYLFKDADRDTGSSDRAKIDGLSADQVWERISDALIEEIVGIPAIRAEAERLGIVRMPVR